MPKISAEDFEKNGTAYLKDYLMEGVVPEQISEQDGRWCAAKFLLLVGAVRAGLLHEEVFEQDNPFAAGRYAVVLEERLKTMGFTGVRSFECIPNVQEQLASLGL